MARILGIHGIAQEYRGPQTLKAAWMPALRDGLALGGVNSLSDDDLAIAFYGDIFRPQGSKAAGLPPLSAADLTPGFETELLEALWVAAAAADSAVAGPESKTKVRTSARAQRALNAISQSRLLTRLTEKVIVGFIKQVHAYLTDESVRAEIQARVEQARTDDTAVLIGHSLGSVVAYEAACSHPDWDVALVTLGSPLGIRNLVFDRLRPPPRSGRGRFPAGAATWTNIADSGDAVALVKALSPLFDGQITDKPVHNGGGAHDISPYLTAAETGRAVADGLGRRERR